MGQAFIKPPTPLLLAAAFCRLPIMRLLLDAGALVEPVLEASTGVVQLPSLTYEGGVPLFVEHAPPHREFPGGPVHARGALFAWGAPAASQACRVTTLPHRPLLGCPPPPSLRISSDVLCLGEFASHRRHARPRSS